MHLIHGVGRSRFDTIPKIEATLRSMDLSSYMFHSVDRMFTNFYHLLSGMLSAKFLALTHAPRCVRRQEHMVLKFLSM